MPDANRRLSPRVEVRGHLVAELHPDGSKLRIIDISLGGFLAESQVAVTSGTTYRIQFATPDGPWWTTLLSATVAHSRLQGVSDGCSTYVSGFAFEEPDAPATTARIQALIDQVIEQAKQVGPAASGHSDP